jgi:hypothetical protein
MPTAYTIFQLTHKGENIPILYYDVEEFARVVPHVFGVKWTTLQKRLKKTNGIRYYYHAKKFVLIFDVPSPKFVSTKEMFFEKAMQYANKRANVGQYVSGKKFWVEDKKGNKTWWWTLREVSIHLSVNYSRVRTRIGGKVEVEIMGWKVGRYMPTLPTNGADTGS